MQPNDKMRVLVFPDNGAKVNNPYCELLCHNMESLGASTDGFTPLRAIFGRYNIFHLHWPEYYLVQSAPKAVIGTLGLLLSIMWSRLRGTRIVWTAHNLHSHRLRYPKAEGWFWRALIPMVDGFIGLSEFSIAQARAAFPALRSIPAFVIPHGHYRGSYPNTTDRIASCQKLGIPADKQVALYFGSIIPYKNVPLLIDTFLRVDLPDAVLLVAGSPSSAQEALQLKEQARNDSRIQLHLRRIPDDEVQTFFSATDLVVLPFREIMNSGSAVLALSFDRPVLVPAIGSMPELQMRVGDDWVRTYAGELNAPELSAAIAWAHDSRRPAKPNLSDFDWNSIARDTLTAFKQLTERVSATACASAAGTDVR
jgi:glycosyltransferase involved in cell wall biosynthesis